MLRQPSGADRRQAIDVLVRSDDARQRRAVKTLGHGQLEQDAAHLGVVVELLDEGRHLLLFGVGGQVAMEIRDPDLCRGVEIPSASRSLRWAVVALRCEITGVIAVTTWVSALPEAA